MKVTAFIRKKARSKSDLVTKATIYFRVRDDYENVDIKAASELTINPNHWSHEKQGYKNRLALIREDQRIELENAINAIKSLIVKEYVPPATDYIRIIEVPCVHTHTAARLVISLPELEPGEYFPAMLIEYGKGESGLYILPASWVVREE